MPRHPERPESRPEAVVQPDGSRLRVRSSLVARRIGLRSNLEVTTDPRRRLLGLLPSLFTLLNMMSGFLSVLMAITGRPQFAAVLIGISIVLDITDGAVARLVRSVTPFGLQFDSLADLVSFGVAPAILAFTVLSGTDLTVAPVGLLASFLWLACAAIRLARFNVTIDPTADKRFFNGLPSPGAAGVIIASVFAFPAPETDGQRFLAVLVLAVPALLMISSIRYRSFRSLISPKSRRPYGLILFTAALVVGFILDPAITGCVVAYSYLAIPVLLPARIAVPPG
ncbi:MAG: CDP-diacylglycerol--serine O-phosphatidyltransferase [Geodermatophilaceae bacterium]|nr:CDP-diacylglycerol--serine O-phosphatidyltransferase [Geodermatophilaceae bacterium]